MTNDSDTWYNLFLQRTDHTTTSTEIDFITSFINPNQYKSVLDVACGIGRHAKQLTHLGYEVMGIDINKEFIQKATKSCPEGEFRVMDMRNLGSLDRTFDAVIIMWQSFGYFSEDVNKMILEDIYNILREGGKLILDIYNKEFFQNHQGVRQMERNKTSITETKFVKESRLYVTLEYESGFESEQYDWYIYSPETIRVVCEEIGFKTILQTSEFDKNGNLNTSKPRFQSVFKR